MILTLRAIKRKFLVLKVLGVTLRSNHRFNELIKVKLQEANKCLYVIDVYVKRDTNNQM